MSLDIGASTPRTINNRPVGVNLALAGSPDHGATNLYCPLHLVGDISDETDQEA